MWPVLITAAGLAVLMYWLYQRERRPQSWVPALLRSAVVFMLVIALAGPVLRHEMTQRQLGRVVVAVDASQSMKLTDAEKGGAPRFSRAADLLLKGEKPLLKQLSENSDVELVALRGAQVQRLWWHRQQGKDSSGELPSTLDLQPDANVSNLDQTLRAGLGAMSAGTALVLLTDGQHNAEGSPEELAGVLKGSSIPVFPIGFGVETPPSDLAVLDIAAPEAVFTKEQVQGRITVQDSMPPNLPAVVKLESQGKTLWEQAFVTDGKGARSFDYVFEMQAVPGAAADAKDKNLRLLSVSVAAAGDKAAMERTRSNNFREVALHVLQKKRKILLIDGRPRWETRYAHNHYERDERWETKVIFDDSSSDNQSRAGKDFPSTREELLTYDLVVLGDMAPQRLRAESVEWLMEYVEKRGGGLVLLDGAAGKLRDWSQSKAASILPVQWLGDGKGLHGTHTWQLTSDAERHTALRLSDSPSANASLWPSLPTASWTAQVKALPGGFTLATLQAKDGSSAPAMVLRNVGAGAVLYLSTDQLWRWRYQVADLYHQRLWMQVGAWIAAPPFQLDAGRISVGTDRLRYSVGEQAEIRVRLRNASGGMLLDAAPRAYLYHDEKESAALNLEPDPTHPGVYRALTPPLKAGDWQVAVSESPTATKTVERLSLRVAEGGNSELATLTMNRPLLETMARTTSGRFLREEQAVAELPRLLEAADAKQVSVEETLLWSSWWWLLPIIILLTAEWLMRRKLRLV